MGCGDGIFTSSLKHLFNKSIGIEPSDLYEEAVKRSVSEEHNSLRFYKMDANITTFDHYKFDVVVSRRGPNPTAEIFRLLKDGGRFVFITIGEKDAIGIKRVFGRGQMHGGQSSVLEELIQELKDHGFQIEYGSDFLYEETYTSEESLHAFLQRVPIFEDYSNEDIPLLRKYCHDNYNEQKEICLKRHRVVLCAQKMPNKPLQQTRPSHVAEF